ncbi:hypothetical protein DTO063F5_2852 [Paecilomyces variotii]|nr:hypothetical protein DTO063F5_2852 [Paecilomyces variotii]KAJ9405085.1 hypothetical protein DTO045G8_7258 [Paecilomyces variotii]
MCRSLNQPVRCLYRHQQRRQQHYCRPTITCQNRRFPALGIHAIPNSRHSTVSTDSKSDELVSNIVRGRLDHGVQVDQHGQLEIVSEEVSRQPHKTALILSRASKSLELYDFIRLLNHRVAAKGNLGLEGGPEEVFPLRHHRTLQKRDTWILTFTTPAQAREYQKEASELRHLAARFMSDPSSGVRTPHHLGQHGPRPYDYTLTSPFQSLSLVAQLAPFDFKLQRGMNTQTKLTQERHPGRKTFPVRLWTGQFSGQLSTRTIKNFLELDGQARGSPWRISEGEDAVIRLAHYFTSGISRNNLDEDSESHISGSIGNWCIGFQCASDARRFVRVWHRKHFPERLVGSSQVTIKAECLF